MVSEFEKKVPESEKKVPDIDNKVLDFDKKHLKRDGGHIGRNVVQITMKMRTIVRIIQIILTVNVISWTHPFSGVVVLPLYRE